MRTALEDVLDGHLSEVQAENP